MAVSLRYFIFHSRLIKHVEELTKKVESGEERVNEAMEEMLFKVRQDLSRMAASKFDGEQGKKKENIAFLPTDPVTNRYHCPKKPCFRSFPTYESLIRHYLQVHLEVPLRSSFRCTWPGCCFLRNQRKILQKHICTKHFQLSSQIVNARTKESRQFLKLASPHIQLIKK